MSSKTSGPRGKSLSPSIGSAPPEPKKETRQYWLFQYREGVRVERSFEAALPDTIVPWKITAHKSRVQAGDIVFFWRAGTEGGLKGWGTVEGQPARALNEPFDRIGVKVRANFGDPIARDVVRALPEVSDLTVIKQGRQGTNFAVSTFQAFGLARLIKSQGHEPPPVPIDEVREILARRLKRDMGELLDAVATLPDDRRTRLRARVMDIKKSLDSATWDPVQVFNDLDTIRSEAEAATVAETTEDMTGLPSEGTVVFQRAAQQAASNLGDLAALGLAESPEPAEALAGLEGDADGARSHFPPLVPPAPAAQKGAPSPPPPPSTPKPTAPPNYWRWHEKDRVGIAPEVTNLARYIAHEELRPPQAIGIFGDWGSGKTFFMNALRSQIGLTAWQSREALEQKRRSVFCSRVVQIDFNAWHYVESNLWASLAGHIFEQLHTALTREASKESLGSLDPNALFAKLATYQEAMQERDRKASLVLALEVERTDLEERVKAERRSIGQALSTAMAVVSQAARAELAKLGGEQRERVRKLVGVESVEALYESTDELRAVARDGDGLARQVSAEVRTMSGGGYAILAAAGIIVLLGVPAFADWLRVIVAGVWPAVAANPAIAEVAFKAGTMMASAAAIVRALAGRGKRLLQTARIIHEHVVAAQQQSNVVKKSEIDAANQEIAGAEQALAESESVLRQRREELATIEAALKAENPGVQLRTFLEGRVRDRSYEQHLGLISLVRRDFQFLSDRMREYWRTRVSGHPYAEVDIVDLKTGATVKQRVPFIERIVLYVDDLDRCPPEKVVDVLQAVHLLLGFELFVVVVAVDVRWVGRSLSKQYAELLSAGDFAEGSGSSWERASSDDYLEKIFQIPFRLVNLNHGTSEQYVRAVLREPFLAQMPGDADADVPTVDLAPKEASLYPEEVECIETLHAWLGRSPRRVNRFVNVYRLMRAGMEEGEVEALITHESYREVLALFALLTGSARLGARLIEQLHRALRSGKIKGTGFTEWLKTLPDIEKYDEDEVAAARAIFAYLDQLGNRRSVEALMEWIPQVAQYSYRQVRIGDIPS